MTTYSDSVRAFIISNDMGENLTTAVIEQFEGEECFLDVYQEVIQEGIQVGYGKWFAHTHLHDFFEVNKVEIIDFIKEQSAKEGVQSYLEFIAAFGLLNIGDIELALQDDESDNYNKVIAAISWFIAEETARNYALLSGEEF